MANEQVLEVFPGDKITIKDVNGNEMLIDGKDDIQLVRMLQLVDEMFLFDHPSQTNDRHNQAKVRLRQEWRYLSPRLKNALKVPV